MEGRPKRRDEQEPAHHETQVNTTILTLCLNLCQHSGFTLLNLDQGTNLKMMSPSPRLSMLNHSMTEIPLFDGEPRTPARHIENGVSRANVETNSTVETHRENRLSGLHVDTRVGEPLQSGSRRISPSTTTGDSPASSTSNHSRQDSTASYTPLRSARGSLSLGVSRSKIGC